MTQRLTDEELAELERLERAATAGPWLTDPVEDYDGSIHEVYGPSYTVHGRRSATVLSQCAPPRDAALITAARNALPALLREVRELREELSDPNKCCIEHSHECGRESERAAIVAWLREPLQPDSSLLSLSEPELMKVYADAIERGEHRG